MSETPPNDEVTLKVVMDHREPDVIRQILQEMGMEVTIAQLAVADYVFSDEVACERKTGQDFVTSLMDNRLFMQVDQLTETYSQPLLVLEDLPSAFERLEWKRRKKHVFGALTYISLRRRVPIIPTASLEETAILLNRIASWTQEEKTDPVLARSVSKKKPLKDQQVFFLEGLHDVGQKRALQLLEAFNNSPHEVIKAIVESRVQYTKSGRPKGIEGPLSKIKGLGPKFVLKNKELLGVRNDAKDDRSVT